MPAPPHPVGSLHLLGLDDRRLDLVLTVILVTVVVVSRLASFPASIWEQDEALFAAAVLHFDPTDNLPHPPWFPLWIGMGRLVHLAGFDAATALQLVSLVFSIWILFPLTALWSTILPRRLAVGAAVIFLVTPGAWFLSGRAFCGTTSTALLTSALAFWLQAGNRPRWLAAGSVMAALAVLVRPQLLPAAIGAMVVIGLRTPAGRRWRPTAAFVIPIVVGGLVFVVSAGAWTPLWAAIEEHGRYHFSRLGEATHGLAGSGLSRCLGHPAAAVLWSALSLIGVITLVRERRWRAVSPVVAGTLVPLLVVIHGLSNPAHARYAVPVLALTSGLVVIGINVLLRRGAWIAIAAVTMVATFVILPQLRPYRTEIAPPIAAVDEAMLDAQQRNGVVVADRTLHAFFVLRRLSRPTPVTVLFDHMLELGHAPPPPPDRTVYVYDEVNGGLLLRAERSLRFSCPIPLARTLAQDRFLDVRVADGATLRRHPDAGGPSVLVD